MPTFQTTPGRLLLREVLPERYHHYLDGPLDKGTMQEMMTDIAAHDEEQYEQILQKLTRYGEEMGSTYGREASLSSDSYDAGEDMIRIRKKLSDEIQSVRDSDMPLEEKETRIVGLMQQGREDLKEAAREAIKGTSFEAQLESGVRGNLDQITDILAGEIIPIDSDGAPVPLPITRGFAERLTPSQYWTSAQKARMGLIGVKLATPEAGDISNQIMQAVQKLRVTQEHEPEGSKGGLPVDPTDPDYTGSVLAQDVEDIAEAGDKITPKLARLMKDRGIGKVLIHSPITSQVPFGVSRDAIGTSTGQDYSVGNFAGITASQSLLEPLTQANIGSKHSGQRSASGTDVVKDLISVPADFPNEAAVSGDDGYVQEIHQPEVGDGYIKVDGEKYPLPAMQTPRVGEGDKVAKGQVMSSGVPNPARLVELVGVGEGRRRFADAFSRALRDAGIDHNKRNAEFIARGLVNHARIQRPYKGYTPGELVEYGKLMREYEPREGAQKVSPSNAKGKYLEEPVAHYTPGTQLSESMAQELKDLGYDELLVHDQDPPFQPEMRRAREARRHSDNWIERLGGSGLKRSFMRSLEGGRGEAKVDDPTNLFSQLTLQGRPQKPDEQFQKEMMDVLS